jgi:2-polyprenyl-3-methyl-5-hydroxy-6-metoxy-1,4-benzoquinol methylase
VNEFGDAQILASWHKNAAPWTTAVRSGQIESRKLVTDRAIVDAVVGRSPQSVLDVGCGEGWLCRELSQRGIRATGIDVVPALIETARSAGGGTFDVASYEDIVAGRFRISVDAIVCNFALLGEHSVEGLLAAVPRMLNVSGALIVQTLHPVVACGDLPYRDGWRRGSWLGFSADFTDAPPWYFRTLESWIRLLLGSGLKLREMCEPLHPVTGKPASVLFVAEADVQGRRGS